MSSYPHAMTSCGAASSAAGAVAHGDEDGHHSEASPDVSTAVERRALPCYGGRMTTQPDGSEHGGYPWISHMSPRWLYDVVCFSCDGENMSCQCMYFGVS